MIKEIVAFIEKELAPLKESRAKCGHEGQTGAFCGRCGADLREVASYECRLCELTGNNSLYPSEKCPNFCTVCGAPKFTFRPIRKKRSK
ncbi:MAG: hypothetical protein WCX65_08435 [bacterium]